MAVMALVARAASGKGSKGWCGFISPCGVGWGRNSRGTPKENEIALKSSLEKEISRSFEDERSV